ncbi:MAG: hypothetical protein WCH01_18640 [Methylococcaceae bacterium]
MTETIPVYIKATDKVLQAEPAPDNQAIQTDARHLKPYRKAMPRRALDESIRQCDQLADLLKTHVSTLP